MKYVCLLVIILQMGNCQGNKSRTVALQPLGTFDKRLLDTISSTIEDIYNFRVLVYPAKSLPNTAFIKVKSARYRADSLLDYLGIIKPDSVDHIMGLTASDISTTVRDNSGEIKKPLSKYADWGVFGLGYMPGESSVVSVFRLKHKDQNRYIERLKKVCIHELGHNLGLPHCTTYGCIMSDANETIRTVDNEKLELCSGCKMIIGR